MTTCEICGSRRFEAGPGGRRTASGGPTQCAGCGSLERHRIAHGILSSLFAAAGARVYDALQFSREPTLRRDWFRSLEISLFGSANSLDLQRIDRLDASYGFVLCCHVLEHVPDHRAALREIQRILRPEGFAYLAWPSPMTRQITDDWGYADPRQHGHFRIFGRDFEGEMGRIVAACFIMAIEGRDPVTGLSDRHYVISQSRWWCDRLLSLGNGTHLVAKPFCVAAAH